MTTKDRLAALELTQKELCKTGEVLRVEIKDIKENHLPHLALAIEDVRDIAKSARFRAGVTLAGLGSLGLMIVVLGIMVAMG